MQLQSVEAHTLTGVNLSALLSCRSGDRLNTHLVEVRGSFVQTTDHLINMSQQVIDL